jgi:nitrate reductase gamma subunit
MHSLYQFVSGPLAWVAFSLFVGGCLFRLLQLLNLARRKERLLFSFFSLRYSLRSLFHWMVPFGAVNMRQNPTMTVVTFGFHICLLLVPVFLLAHVVLWEEAWGIQWWTLSDLAADGMTLVVVAACGYFLVRRLRRPEVKYVTGPSDYMILTMVAAPFITGFYCRLQWPGYETMVIIHILSSEIMLAAIPFTRLVHMVYAVFTRSYTGSEFGGIRHARDW